MDPPLSSSISDTSTRLSLRKEPIPSTSSSSLLASTSRPRIPSSSSILSSSTTASPFTSSTSSIRPRHSLYGTEDRIVLDLGSKIWKIGFSGEVKPRTCKSVLRMIGEENVDIGSKKSGKEEFIGLWGLEKGKISEVEWELREQRLKKGLRDVWFNHLMSDPKARKVIIVENLLMSTRVKEMIARVLFENLQVPSISFASGHLLSLMATGTVTGLVVDCGNLETTCLPIYSSRPLFPLLLTTPAAGSRLNKRLKSLLIHFGSYIPPASSLNSSIGPVVTKIPKEILTEEFLEEIKTRVCFVGERLDLEEEAVEESESMPMDTRSDYLTVEEYEESEDSILMNKLERLYSKNCTTTTISFKVPSLSLAPVISGVGSGWIQIPGWVRERAAEVLFEEGDEDELSLTEVILETLLRLPLDLRKPLASSILVTGGTASLPGFFPRLRTELLTTLLLSQPPDQPLTPPLSPNPNHSTLLQRQKLHLSRQRLLSRLSLLRTSPHFSILFPLISILTITNDPSLTSTMVEYPLPMGEGKVPGFNPSLLPWIGGSLAGALKTGGEELTRNKWMEDVNREIVGDGVGDGEGEERRRKIPDWSDSRRVVS